MSNYWLKELSLWSNDFDYIIARTLKEAKIYAGQMMFGKHNPEALELYEQFEKDELDSADWHQLDPNSKFEFSGNCDGSIEEKTVQEFIEIFGAGYFACSEW